MQTRLVIPTVLACIFPFALTSCGRSPSVSPVASLPIPSTKDAGGTGILDFPDGSKFQTTLYDLKVIGQLRTARKLPYYILSGVGCTACDENTSIYIRSPSDGPMKGEGSGQPRFDYPGREISRVDRSVVSETRVFVGNCAVKHPDAVIWFYRLRGDDNRWQEKVYLAEVKDDRLVDGWPKTEVPKLGEAEDAVRKSQCRELAGTDQWQEP